MDTLSPAFLSHWDKSSSSVITDLKVIYVLCIELKPIEPKNGVFPVVRSRPRELAVVQNRKEVSLEDQHDHGS